MVLIYNMAKMIIKKKYTATLPTILLMLLLFMYADGVLARGWYPNPLSQEAFNAQIEKLVAYAKQNKLENVVNIELIKLRAQDKMSENDRKRFLKAVGEYIENGKNGGPLKIGGDHFLGGAVRGDDLDKELIRYMKTNRIGFGKEDGSYDDRYGKLKKKCDKGSSWNVMHCLETEINKEYPDAQKQEDRRKVLSGEADKTFKMLSDKFKNITPSADEVAKAKRDAEQKKKEEDIDKIIREMDARLDENDPMKYIKLEGMRAELGKHYGTPFFEVKKRLFNSMYPAKSDNNNNNNNNYNNDNNQGTATKIDFIKILTNLTADAKSIFRLTTIISYVIGFWLVIAALMGLRRSELGSSGSQGNGIAGPIVKFFIGIALIYLPGTINLTTSVVWGDAGAVKSILAYAAATPSPFEVFRGTAIAIVRLIGLIAFISGFVELAHSSDQQAQPGSVAKGILRVFSGMLALNVVATVRIIGGVFGMPNIL